MKKLATLLALLCQPGLMAETVTIGTGGELGLYHQITREYCRLAHEIDEQLECKQQTTSGSIENLQRVKRGEVAYAMVQSDWLYQASKGLGPFATQPQPELRALFATHAEPFTIVIRADGDITSLEQLKLAPIDMGLKSSGTRQTALALFNILGAKEQDLDLKSMANDAEALCSKQIDAFALVMGHRTGSYWIPPNAAPSASFPSKGRYGINCSRGSHTTNAVRCLPASTLQS